jgi:hypothetical protein
VTKPIFMSIQPSRNKYILGTYLIVDSSWTRTRHM